eukprot:763623-Hanusia_phi.AAC.10
MNALGNNSSITKKHAMPSNFAAAAAAAAARVTGAAAGAASAGEGVGQEEEGTDGTTRVGTRNGGGEVGSDANVLRAAA